jgi:hypothetical protein
LIKKLQRPVLLSKQQEKPSALKKENIQHCKTKILNFLLFLRVIFALLDPDSDCESGYGSRDPIESGSGSTALPGPVFIFGFFLNAGSDSPKKLGGVEKGPAPNPPLGGGEAQLKYENDRLKLALAQSSANAKVGALLDTSQRFAICPEGLKGSFFVYKYVT